MGPLGLMPLHDLLTSTFLRVTVFDYSLVTRAPPVQVATRRVFCLSFIFDPASPTRHTERWGWPGREPMLGVVGAPYFSSAPSARVSMIFGGG